MAIHLLDGSANPPKNLKITFRIQKNRQNGQSITFVADDKLPQICPAARLKGFSFVLNDLTNQTTNLWESL
jgi:hypothetical protein